MEAHDEIDARWRRGLSSVSAPVVAHDSTLVGVTPWT